MVKYNEMAPSKMHKMLEIHITKGQMPGMRRTSGRSTSA